MKGEIRKCDGCGADIIGTGKYLQEFSIIGTIQDLDLKIANCTTYLKPKVLSSLELDGSKLYSFFRENLDTYGIVINDYELIYSEISKTLDLDEGNTIHLSENFEIFVHKSASIDDNYNGEYNTLELEKNEFTYISSFFSRINMISNAIKNNEFYVYFDYFDEEKMKFILSAISNELDYLKIKSNLFMLKHGIKKYNFIFLDYRNKSILWR